MGDGFILTGATETRVFDFFRIKHAIQLEQKGIGFGERSVVHAATDKGYVPRELVGRGTLILRREKALEYMSYVATLLTTGGNARKYGEEIVMGHLKYSGTDDCGCPNYSGTEQSDFFNAPDVGVMCIHKEGNE